MPRGTSTSEPAEKDDDTTQTREPLSELFAFIVLMIQKAAENFAVNDNEPLFIVILKSTFSWALPGGSSRGETAQSKNPASRSAGEPSTALICNECEAQIAIITLKCHRVAEKFSSFNSD